MGVLRGSTGGLKAGCSTMICLVLWAESKERPQQVVCYTAEGKTRGLDLEERKKT